MGNLQTGNPAPALAAPTVRRPRLLKHLLSSPPARVVVLTAPAGFSKTTCLSEWAAVDDRPFAWVQAERRHDDPAALARAIVDAIDSIAPLDPEVSAALSSPAPSMDGTVLPRLRDALAPRAPFVLVVDDVHLIGSPESNELLRSVVEVVGEGSQMALGSRTEPNLPLGRMRAHRQLIELAQRELALTAPEAGELLENTGLRLTPAQVGVIHDRTEGWPAATYLAGLALADQPDLAAAVRSFAGDDRFIVDYLREEFLVTTSDARMRFLIRSSLLDELAGPVCDAVLERTGSARVLKELAKTNALVVPLDRGDTTYRYHHLFAELLTGELRRREPELEPELHSRASRWYAEHGDAVRAIDHAIAADQPTRAGELIWLAFPELSGRGRMATIRSWLDLLGEERVKSGSALSLTETHYHLVTGDADRGAHWARVAEAAARKEPGGTEAVAADLHVLEATFSRSGATAMEAEAARASEMHPPESPWQAPSHLYRGVASHITGHPERAKPMLREAVRRGAVSSPIIETMALVQLALIAFEDGDMGEALRLTAQAHEQVERCGMQDYGSSLSIYAASSMVLASEGRVERAESDADRACALLASMSGMPIWYEAQAHVVLARALIRLGRTSEADEQLGYASEYAGMIADAVVLAAWLADAREALGRASAGGIEGGDRLTRAELRTLQYLPSHLSFRAIGEAIHVSPNTVKTQAQAAYRKLGASSRAEAVERARAAGLLSEDDRPPSEWPTRSSA